MTGEAEYGLSLLRAAFPEARVVEVIHHKENRMTEQTPEPEATEGQAPWDAEPEQNWDGSPKTPIVTYPEAPLNPHNHVYTWSPKLPDGSMLVIRAQSAAELVDAVAAMAPQAGRLRAAWQSVTGQPAPAPAQPYQQAPQGQFQPQGGVNYDPQTPPANQPYPGQPAWQQAGAPQAAPPQWGAPQAPQQQWGGQQAAPQGGQQRKEYPAPQGWMRMNGQKAQVDGIAGQFGIPKGAPAKGGKYNFYGLPVKSWYCAPEVAQAFAQLNPMAA